MKEILPSSGKGVIITMILKPTPLKETETLPQLKKRQSVGKPPKRLSPRKSLGNRPVNFFCRRGR